jgi:hypothetical protein
VDQFAGYLENRTKERLAILTNAIGYSVYAPKTLHTIVSILFWIGEDGGKIPKNLVYRRQVID